MGNNKRIVRPQQSPYFTQPANDLRSLRSGQSRRNGFRLAGSLQPFPHARPLRRALEFPLDGIRQTHPFAGSTRLERAVHHMPVNPDESPCSDFRGSSHGPAATNDNENPLLQHTPPTEPRLRRSGTLQGRFQAVLQRSAHGQKGQKGTDDFTIGDIFSPEYMSVSLFSGRTPCGS